MTVAMTAGRVRFAPRARWDRDFFLLIVALIWLGVLMGFVPEIVGRIQAHKPAFPLIVPIHGAAFVGWLCLLTTQVLLIRSGRPDIHKRLGLAAAVLAPTMVVLGLGASWTMDRLHFGTSDSDPSFIAIQLADLTNFGVLAAAAIVWRKISFGAQAAHPARHDFHRGCGVRALVRRCSPQAGGRRMVAVVDGALCRRLPGDCADRRLRSPHAAAPASRLRRRKPVRAERPAHRRLALCKPLVEACGDEADRILKRRANSACAA